MTEDGPVEPSASAKYHSFLLSLYDIMAEAVEDNYDEEALAYLSRARRFFIKEFNERHPDWAARPEETRALWPDP